MKFIADINIPQSLIKQLVNTNHDVLDVKKQNIQISDTEIIKLARKELRIILTRDKDFIILSQFPKYQIPIIAIRLINQTDTKYITDRVFNFIINASESTIQNSLTIIRDDKATSYQYPFDTLTSS